MPVHRLQRWPNNVPRLVMNVSMGIIEFMFLYWRNVVDGGS